MDEPRSIVSQVMCLHFRARLVLLCASFLLGCLQPYQRTPVTQSPQADSSQVAVIPDTTSLPDIVPEVISQIDTSFAAPLATEDKVEDKIVAQFKDNRIAVQVAIVPQESRRALGERILQDPNAWQALPAASVKTDSGEYLDTPFAWLNYEAKKKALQQVFPQDIEHDEGWVHIVQHKGETMWAIAEIFTGEGNKYPEIERANNLPSHSPLSRGQRIRIPANLLSKSLRDPSSAEFVELPQDTLSAPAAIARAAEKPVSHDPDLKFRKSGGEWFGVYKLRRGEALYSAVVVRFTGRVDADDVNQIARQLMRINNIRDETAIPAGTSIRIPLRLIDEALLTAEEEEAPRAQVRRGPGKLHVILDAGHGGNDPGTMVRGWREADLAYDLMRRLQGELEQRGVVVHPLVSSRPGRAAMSNGHNDKRHKYVLVTPPYLIEDSRVALNLRINLIDAIYERLLAQGVSPSNIILISIHLDHLHPSVNGAMVYFPGAKERTESYGAWWDGVYAGYAESRRRTISFAAKESRQAESASENFARSLIAAFRRSRVPVHTYEPIRQYVYRGGRKWTPGIIRYSRVPTSILLEAANLANHSDHENMRSTAFRQRFTEAVAKAIAAEK